MNYFNPFQQNYDNMYSYNTVPQVVKVNGYNGANAYQLPPNASALLLDETQPIVWLVKSDGAGYKSVLPSDNNTNYNWLSKGTHNECFSYCDLAKW